MSRSKSSKSYGVEMVQLSFLAKEQFPLHLEFPTEAAAKGWRLTFYGFRRALELEKDSRHSNLAAIQARVVRNTMILEHLDATEAGQIVQAALAAALGKTHAPASLQLAPAPEERRRVDSNATTTAVEPMEDAIGKFLRGD